MAGAVRLRLSFGVYIDFMLVLTIDRYIVEYGHLGIAHCIPGLNCALGARLDE